MADFYLDTSALVKRYIAERGTRWMLALTDAAVGHYLYTIRLTGAEATAALYRKFRSGEVTAAELRRGEAEFLADWGQQYLLVEANAATVGRAMDVARRYPLRGYDAVHVAAAPELGALLRGGGGSPVTFVSADQGQRRVAEAEGLTVEDPNRHI